MPGNEQCIFAGLMADDIKGMNACINKIALEMFSFFDTGKGKQSKPERFYHGHFNGIDGKISKESGRCAWMVPSRQGDGDPESDLGRRRLASYCGRPQGHGGGGSANRCDSE